LELGYKYWFIQIMWISRQNHRLGAGIPTFYRSQEKQCRQIRSVCLFSGISSIYGVVPCRINSPVLSDFLYLRTPDKGTITICQNLFIISQYSAIFSIIPVWHRVSSLRLVINGYLSSRSQPGLLERGRTKARGRNEQFL